MKPGKEQQKQLKKYLRQNLRYRETCEEFYDHLLSALELQPAGVSLGEALNGIISEDFGGINGMIAIENKHQQQARKEMQRKYLYYATKYLVFSAIGVIGFSAVLICYLVMQPWFNFGLLFVIIIAMRLIPSIINIARWLKPGHTFLDTKKSIWDNYYRSLNYIPALIFAFLVIILSYIKHVNPVIWFKSINPAYVTIFLLLCILHTITYCRVYSDVLKISIIN